MYKEWTNFIVHLTLWMIFFFKTWKKLLSCSFKTQYTFKKSIKDQIISSEYNGKNNIKSMTFTEKCA